MRGSLSRTPILFGAALSLSVACSGDFDDSRKPSEPVGTLGDDLYTAMCDRVGASVLTEDLSGASYHPICHRDQFGKYADQVDQSKLPPVAGTSAVARKLALAKLGAMVRRRDDLIRAFNQTFSDAPVDDPFHPGQTVPGHVALQRFLQRVVPLYETNPVDTAGTGPREGLMPSVTRAAGRLFAGLGGPGQDPQAQFGDPAKAKAAQLALARLSGRLGYRPLRVALGAIKPSMAYPDLRNLAQTMSSRMGPGGIMREAFQNVLGMTQNELATSLPQPIPAPYQILDASTLQPNRPRTNVEVARAIMLSTNPAFAAPGAEPRYMVVRDPRGYAVPAGNQPGVPGTVGGAFVDMDGDGLADVDSTGRFLGPSGGLAQVDTPFVVPGLGRFLPPDVYGRAVDPGGNPVYQYLNTSETFVGATTRDLDPLLNPDPVAESEAIADLLSGAYALYGDPIQNKADWAVGGIYPSFDTSQSPMLDLIHATGWMFSHKRSDVHLKFLAKLFDDTPGPGGAPSNLDLTARVVGAALKIREVSNQHPEIKLDPSVTIWDELQEVLVQTAKDPALFKDVLRALAHPDTQAYMGNAYSNYSKWKDALYYDTNNINGPPVNLTDASNPEPHVPTDLTKPDVGDDRSDMYRILQIIHDVNGVNACNKEGAKVKALGITVPGSYSECELFYFENMGVFYLESILGKAKLNVRSGFLNLLLTLGGALGLDPDGVFEDGSGITGMTRTPTAEALNRLVFFGSQSTKFDPMFGGQMPDRDPNWNGKNGKTNEFISLMLDATSTAVCPERLVNVPNASGGEPPSLWLADCGAAGGDKNDLLRLRGKGIIFLWEKYDFYKGMRPLLKAYDDHGKSQLFLDTVETLYRHWPTDQHGPECNNNGNFGDRPWAKFLSDADRAAHKVNPAYNAKYCNSSGVTRYEPILAEAFASDLLPALGELVKRIDDPNFVSDDRNGGTKLSGLDIMDDMTLALMDPDYASSVGMIDRFGNKTAKWANGQISKPQLTMFDLFAEAMRNIDVRLPDGSARQTRWRRARSKLVDQFLTVDGDGANAHFRNTAFVHSVPILVNVIREQINANCPDRETSSVPCDWAVNLDKKANETMSGPVFGTTMFLLDLINEDEEARRALEKHLQYLVQSASQNDAKISMLASSVDMMQILGDDENMPPIYQAIATAAAPEYATETVNGKDKPAPGTADRVLELFQALTNEPVINGKQQPNQYDPYRIQDRIMANLVTPMDGNEENPTPIEIFLDTFAEVNRIDADLPREEPLSPDDMEVVMGTMRDFLTSKTRGMEQFYEIMKHRNGD